MTGTARIVTLHLAVIVLLYAAQFVLPPDHATTLARILVLAVFAIGYNIAFGYGGLLSLGHGLFFAAGMYGAGLPGYLLEWAAMPSLIAGVTAGGSAAGLVGLLALRGARVSFMIVTLVIAQAGYLSLLYFDGITGGNAGFVVDRASRTLMGLDLALGGHRDTLALGLFASGMLVCLALVRSRFGREMLAMRENDESSRVAGHDPFAVKLAALVISGLYAGAAGAAYAMLFGYVSASFSTIQYSILPVLCVLIGGAGTVLGPLFGAAVVFYLIAFASSQSVVWLLGAGLVLALFAVFVRHGILGIVRDKWLPWLP